MSLNAMEIAKMAREFQSRPTPKTVHPTAKAGRAQVVVGRYKIGDTIRGNTITGFGKSWTARIMDEDASEYGLRPTLGDGQYVTVCYAYFN